MAQRFKPIAVAAARAAYEKKGGDIRLYHVAKTSPLADYILIVTALSHTHFNSLEQEVLKAVKAFGLHILHRARPESDKWRVVDFGGLLIHLMTAEAREFYSLDKLHMDSPKIKWLIPPRNSAVRPTRKRTSSSRAGRLAPARRRPK